jgi:hypothetical protein
MRRTTSQAIREILREVQRRVPAGQRFVQEAFTTEHGRPVRVRLAELEADVFYVFDEFSVCAFREAMLDWASFHQGGRVTVTCAAFGEVQAQRHRLEHAAGKVGRLRVLTLGNPPTWSQKATGLEMVNTNSGILSGYRFALKEGAPTFLFVARELPERGSAGTRCVGFFTADPETVDEVASDLDLVLNRRARSLPAFERLQVLHQTTQRVARELTDYSRRMELAIQRARRRPDLLTPARFDRIVRQSILKMEQLKEIPRRALRTLGKGSA